MCSGRLRNGLLLDEAAEELGGFQELDPESKNKPHNRDAKHDC
jgi:hypothetical protein